MNELYELAKQIDVIIIFYIFMGASIYGIVSTVMNGVCLSRILSRNVRKRRNLLKIKLKNKNVQAVEDNPLPSVLLWK